MSVIPKTCSHRDNDWSALFVDGSFDDDGKGGLGVILRDLDGGVIFSAHRNVC
jgi:hypothetical protein